MSSSVDRTAGEITKAYYQYNGLGHRVGQTIASGNADVTQTIRYTLDLTRQYHNLLQKTGNGLDQIYFWDGNVAGMEENGRDHFYFQDDLGSPMRLADEDGKSEEVYGFDEFGNDIRTAKDIFKNSLQSFGFTGYQMDSVGALYFAQARRYDAGVGRFISEDFIKGHIAAPYTMNHYSYCWNRPLDLVDLNGMAPTAGVISDLEGMYPELEENDEKNNTVLDWLKYGDGSAVVGDVSNGIDISSKAIETMVTSPKFFESEMKTFDNSVGIGTRANIVTSEIEGYKGVLNNVSKVSQVVGGTAVALDVGMNAYDNVQNGASTTEVLSDASVDAFVDITSMAITGAIIGAVVPVVGNLIGAIIGFIAGLVIYFFTDVITVNGKSFRDWLKDTFLDFLNLSGEMLENAITYVIDGIKDVVTNDANKE